MSRHPVATTARLLVRALENNQREVVYMESDVYTISIRSKFEIMVCHPNHVSYFGGLWPITNYSDAQDFIDKYFPCSLSTVLRKVGLV